MAGTRSTVAERAEWLADLRATLPPGATVHTVLRHVSASGMTRAIDAYSLTCEAGTIEKRWLSYRIAAVLGWTFSQRWESISVGGAGMDMGFHLVYVLSRTLYPDGFDCTGERCPSNDHSNGQPRYNFGAEAQARLTGSGLGTDRPHHADGGYALRHEWL